MFSFSTTTAFVLTVLLCGLVAAGSNNNKNYNCTAIASQNFDGEVFVHAGLYPNDFGKYINRTECAVFKPYTERAVRDYLRWARKGGKIVDGVPSGIPTIPTSGTHHNTFAWDLANGTQILLDLSYLKQINVIYHPITGVPISVKVGCGAHLSDVINITLALGYDVSTTDFMGLSPCGVASGAGGMSPTSPKDGFLATTAEAVTVADYRDGHIETFYRGEQNFKLMLGTAGVMGVMVSITLPLTPIQNNAKTMSLVYFDAQSFKTDADALANSSLCYNAIGSLYLYNAQGKAQSAVVWNDSAVPVGFNNSRFYGLSCTVLYNSTEPSNASMLSLASNYVMSGFAVQPIASKLFATTNMINSRVDPNMHVWLITLVPSETIVNLLQTHIQNVSYSGNILFFIVKNYKQDNPAPFIVTPNSNSTFFYGVGLLLPAANAAAMQTLLDFEQTLYTMLPHYGALPYINGFAINKAMWKDYYNNHADDGLWDEFLCGLKKHNPTLYGSQNTGVMNGLTTAELTCAHNNEDNDDNDNDD